MTRLLVTLVLAIAGALCCCPRRGRSQDEWINLPPANEDAFVVDFPDEEAPLRFKLFEAPPTVLSRLDQPLARLWESLLRSKHYELSTALAEEAIGLQPIPARPPLLIEWNERFLAPGFLRQGIKIPTGAVWRPSLWVFGEFRSGWQYFDRDRAIDPTAEWASRLDLFGQVNLSGTERLLLGIRPLDQERGSARTFSGYDFHNGNWVDGWNGNLQTFFFEGDVGEVFPKLDPYDTLQLDYGFSVGRMPLLAQQGLLINEDMIDAVTITRNTLHGHGNLNLRMTGVYAWRGINRNSAVGRPNDFDPGSRMIALLTESDFAKRTIDLDAAYVYGDDAFGDLFVVAASSIRRHQGYHNSYNTSLHVLASIPNGRRTAYADQGELLFAQTSWTPHHSEDLIYLNAFLAIDQFTSAARGPLAGEPLIQAGLLFAAVGLGNFDVPISATTDNVAGGSLGYQLFFDDTRQQVIWEVGGFKETKGDSRGTLGTGVRYQKAIGQHLIFLVDAFVAKRESASVAQGARTELRVKF